MAIVSDPTPNHVSPIQALAQFRQQQASRHHVDQLRVLVGGSPAVVRARAQVAAAIASGANTLVTGPEPAGLTEVVLAIHHGIHAGGKGGLYRFDALDALPSELSRALGHLSRDQVGGTLLIESIDSLAVDLQAELLTAVAQPDWRAQVIATRSSKVPPSADVSDELAAVVSTLVVEVPPLADRPEDIPLLVEACLADLVEGSTDTPPATLTVEALDLLMVYPWPGELPELYEMLERAQARAGRHPIEPRHLPKIVHHAIEQAALTTDRPEPIDLDDYLSRVESALVSRALELAGGKKAEAARLLGVSRPRLYRKLEQMGLMEPAPTKPKTTPTPPPEPQPTETEPEPTEAAAADEGIEFLPVEGDE